MLRNMKDGIPSAMRRFIHSPPYNLLSTLLLGESLLYDHTLQSGSSQLSPRRHRKRLGKK